MSSVAANARPKQNLFQWIGNHWFAAFLIVYGAWVFMPFLAPVFMHLGWTGAGKAVYFIYSFFCHQLPERSFFWFGEKTMYSLSEIQSAWQNTDNPMILRQFIGNEAMGWKVAWSDRMISFYTGVWLFAALWYPFRKESAVVLVGICASPDPDYTRWRRPCDQRFRWHRSGIP